MFPLVVLIIFFRFSTVLVIIMIKFQNVCMYRFLSHWRLPTPNCSLSIHHPATPLCHCILDSVYPSLPLPISWWYPLQRLFEPSVVRTISNCNMGLHKYKGIDCAFGKLQETRYLYNPLSHHSPISVSLFCLIFLTDLPPTPPQYSVHLSSFLCFLQFQFITPTLINSSTPNSIILYWLEHYSSQPYRWLSLYAVSLSPFSQIRHLISVSWGTSISYPRPR
jgi:hypothetical protein